MNKINVYINGRFLLQPKTGVERYSYEICRALSDVGFEYTLICPRKGTIQNAYDVSGMNIVRYGMGASHFWEQCVLPLFFIGKKRYVLLSLMGLGSILVRNKVMTIHDLSFLYNPSWFSKLYYRYYKLMTPMAVRSSKRIITVSDFSKKEILRFYPFVSSDNIFVIYNAADNRVFKAANRIDESFFLLVSSLDPRKNIKVAIEAFMAMPNIKLKIVGGGNRVFGDSTGIHNLPPNVELLGRIDDEELVSLYTSATAFIFPSIYEGFGIPPLEAMACGCPVIASDIPVLREVCGNSALYFNPFDVDSLREKISVVNTFTHQERERMVGLGLENTTRFMWVNSAKELIKTIEKL